MVFIAIDDLNHWVGHLERNKQTITPNLDRLAGLGVSFSNAQCAAPVCNPSRAALLSGKRPGVTGIYDNGQPFVKGLKPTSCIAARSRATKRHSNVGASAIRSRRKIANNSKKNWTL